MKTELGGSLVDGAAAEIDTGEQASAHTSVRMSVPGSALRSSLAWSVVGIGRGSKSGRSSWLTDALELVSGRTKNYELDKLLSWTWNATHDPGETSTA
jgi:hypothetical protein